jgi:O-antigen/teichoic acid export membrane protein
MNKSSTILRNLASNWAGFAINAIVTLLLTPYVLHELGASRYGIWSITASIIGYYGLLDFGVRSATNQFLTRSIAVGDYRAAGESMSTAVALLVAVGCVCALLTLCAAHVAPEVLRLPDDTRREAFWTILIVGLTSALQFGFFPFMSVFVATQRFDLANLIGVSTRLLSALLVYLMLDAGYGLIGISAATCSASLIDYLVRWRVARRLLPQVVVSRRGVSLGRLRELGSFGVWTFLQSVNTFLYQHGQPLMIGALLPIAAVGHYALASGLSQQIFAVLAPFGHVMYPVAASLHAQGDRESLRRLYHDGSRLMMLVMTCVVVIAAFWADDFYRLWIGEEYLRGSEYPSLALLLRLLLICVAANYVSSIAGQILVGSGHVRQLALLLIGGSVVNLGLGLVLIGPYGLVGAAAGPVIGTLAVDLIAVPLLLQRLVGLPVIDFLRSACVRPAVVGLLLSVCAAVITAALDPAGWLDLALHGLSAGAIAAVLVLSVGITGEERRRLVIRPVAHVLGLQTHASQTRP